MHIFFDSIVVADADFIASLIVGSWIIVFAGIMGILYTVSKNSPGENEGGEEET
jgi:hypothetical protein